MLKNMRLLLSSIYWFGIINEAIAVPNLMNIQVFIYTDLRRTWQLYILFFVIPDDVHLSFGSEISCEHSYQYISFIWEEFALFMKFSLILYTQLPHLRKWVE